ncbi:hypothetical protein VTN96DRAFT_1716 [Rasamsonia emersonii]
MLPHAAGNRAVAEGSHADAGMSFSGEAQQSSLRKLITHTKQIALSRGRSREPPGAGGPVLPITALCWRQRGRADAQTQSDGPLPLAEAAAWFPARASTREEGFRVLPKTEAPRPPPANQRGQTLFPLLSPPVSFPALNPWSGKANDTRGDPGRFIHSIGCAVEPVLDVQATHLVTAVPSFAAARFSGNSVAD